jgi:hypothetical protein
MKSAMGDVITKMGTLKMYSFYTAISKVNGLLQTVP